MAQNSVQVQESVSNDNSISTKEFLNFERTCEAYKDSDEEIKLIFSEISKLSGANNKDTVIGADVEDVELILKRAEDIAHETENLLKSSPKTPLINGIVSNGGDGVVIPQIKVTKPVENKDNEEVKLPGSVKVRIHYNTKYYFLLTYQNTDDYRVCQY